MNPTPLTEDRALVIAFERDFSVTYTFVMPKRPKVESSRQASLFQFEKLEELADLASRPGLHRPFYEPGYSCRSSEPPSSL